MKYLGNHYLDDDWSVSGTEETDFRILIKEVSDTTYTKVINPANFLIYSLLGYKKIKDQAFKIAIIDPDFASMGILISNGKEPYFSKDNKTIGYLKLEQLKEQGVTDEQIQEIENAGFLLQYRTEKRILTLMPSKMLLATLCRQLGIGKLNSGPEPLRDIYLASQMGQRKKFKMVYRKYQGNAKAFACFGLKYCAAPQTIILDILDSLREKAFTESVQVIYWKICHSNTIADFVFPNMEMETEHIKLTPGVRLTTSDIGDSSYTLQNILYVNGHTIVLNELVAKKHTSQLEISEFVDYYAKDIFPSLILILSRIEKLKSMKIKCKKAAIACLLSKINLYHVLGQKNTQSFKEAFLNQLPEQECTGRDVISEILMIPDYLPESIKSEERISKSIGSVFTCDLIKELRQC